MRTECPGCKVAIDSDIAQALAGGEDKCPAVSASVFVGLPERVRCLVSEHTRVERSVDAARERLWAVLDQYDGESCPPLDVVVTRIRVQIETERKEAIEKARTA